METNIIALGFVDMPKYGHASVRSTTPKYGVCCVVIVMSRLVDVTVMSEACSIYKQLNHRDERGPDLDVTLC